MEYDSQDNEKVCLHIDANAAEVELLVSELTQTLEPEVVVGVQGSGPAFDIQEFAELLYSRMGSPGHFGPEALGWWLMRNNRRLGVSFMRASGWPG